MGYYKSKLEEYNANAPSNLTLGQRMEAVKASYEDILEQRLDHFRQGYYSVWQIDPGFRDEKSADNLSQAQNEWSQTVLKPTDKFFEELAGIEKQSVWGHLKETLANYDQTRTEILEIEQEQGLVALFGRIFSGAKTTLLDDLNNTLQAQQTDLNSVMNAYEEFTLLDPTKKAEYVVGHYEQTGTFDYNPEEVLSFYKQNPVETTNVNVTPEEQ